jgi:cell division protein FtsB
MGNEISNQKLTQEQLKKLSEDSKFTETEIKRLHTGLILFFFFFF